MRSALLPAKGFEGQNQQLLLFAEIQSNAQGSCHV
jgi:hypothetical protein